VLCKYKIQCWKKLAKMKKLFQLMRDDTHNLRNALEDLQADQQGQGEAIVAPAKLQENQQPSTSGNLQQSQGEAISPPSKLQDHQQPSTSRERSPSPPSSPDANPSPPLSPVSIAHLPAFEQPTIIFENDQIRVIIQSREGRRVIRFHLEDHLYKINVELKDIHQAQPLMTSLFEILYKALTAILDRLRVEYKVEDHDPKDEVPKHLVYLYITDASLTNGINTGKIHIYLNLL